MKVRSLVISVVALAFIGARGTAGESTPDRRLNVLFLVADDLNSWLLGEPIGLSGVRGGLIVVLNDE